MTPNPALLSGFEHIAHPENCYNVRAQNGPDRGGCTPQPGPDLSASLNLTEEH